MQEIINNKYLILSVSLWVIIQLWKFCFELVKTKKINLKRMVGAGGMPSSHSAIVTTLATAIGKTEGIDSPIFAVSAILALITMYDATGVRRAAGKQAAILNKIINSKNLKDINVQEKLIELIGHTPFEVFIGALIGVIYALIFV